jgi:hypothetical protein
MVRLEMNNGSSGERVDGRCVVATSKLRCAFPILVGALESDASTRNSTGAVTESDATLRGRTSNLVISGDGMHAVDFGRLV